ncbi:MAG: radical SAM protein [Dehalococcoidia bacterium]|nr:radical SAM protein [Dehalococcoidia bacterium]
MEQKYIALYKSGELARRAHELEARLTSCDVCPRECGVNRLEDERGFCHSGRLPIVSTMCAHNGEEPVISGSMGSGTIFFSNCNMMCVYCQNYQISQCWREQKTNEMDCHTIAERMIYLQDELGCHNINFVSPSHFVPQLVQTVLQAVPMGLHTPLIYNTNSYDSTESLKELDGIISIYLPDLKYASNARAKDLSLADNYVEISHAAIKEMHRQVGELVLDEYGVAQKGLIVRHLILPNELAGSRDSLTWLANEISPAVTVSVMSQYSPQHRAMNNQLLSRTISSSEYMAVVNLLDELGLKNGWLQEMGAQTNYLPNFKREGHPFYLQ